MVSDCIGLCVGSSQVGYRQFCTHHTPTRFCFGHGLTYSCFEYSQLSLSAHRMHSTESLQVSVQLTNSGRISAREIVQLYVRDRDCSVHRPDRELRAFGKTKLLEPGASQTLQFTLTPRAFAFYDIRRSDWYVELGFEITSLIRSLIASLSRSLIASLIQSLIASLIRYVEPGEFEILIGASADQIRLIASLIRYVEPGEFEILIGASADQILLDGTVLVVDADGEERPPGKARLDESGVPRNYLRLDDDGLAALGLIVPPADERTPYSANSTVLEIVSMSGCIKGLYRTILRLVGQVMIARAILRLVGAGDDCH